MPSEVIEIQYNSDSTVEYSYRLRSFNGMRLYAMLLEWGLGDHDPNSIELISHHEGDGVTYEDEAVVISCRREVIGTLADYYAIKIHPDGRMVVKEYDWNVDNYSIPELPPGSEIARVFGVGKYSDNIYKDIYFYHDNYREVEEFFRLRTGCVVDSRGLYAITFDDRSHPVKLKRYIYPSDVTLLRAEEL